MVVGATAIGGENLLLTASSGATLGDADLSRDVEGLNAITCALGGLTLAFFGPAVVATAATGIDVWGPHNVTSLVRMGTSMRKVKLSKILGIAVALWVRTK